MDEDLIPSTTHKNPNAPKDGAKGKDKKPTDQKKAGNDTKRLPLAAENNIDVMLREKRIILPQIYAGGPDGDKPWFIHFRYYNKYTGKLKRFRIYEGLGDRKSNEDKLKHARYLQAKYRKKLLSGWDPFEDQSKVVYSDHLAYKNAEANKKITRRKIYSIRIMFSDYLEKYKGSIAPATYAQYQSIGRIFCEFIKHKNLDYDISSVSRKTAMCFFEYLQEKGKSGTTLNKYRTILKAIWKETCQKYPEVKNPFVDIPKFKEYRKPQRPYQRGVLQIIKKKLQDTDSQLWLAAQFMYYCFIRPKEMRFMQLRHIDLYDGLITLHSDITKNAKTRVVQIPDIFLQELLTKYKLSDYPEQYYIFTTDKTPGLKPVSKNYFWYHFNNLKKEINLPADYNFYAFKHTGAVAALKGGADLHTIKNQMGHSSIAITEEYLKDKTGYESDFFKKNMPEI